MIFEPPLVGRALALLLLGVLLQGCGDGTSSVADTGSRPNVLLISIDSLRADHLGCYGYGRRTSPAIDALAAEGVRFQTTISSTSWTLPSHASLFTGLPNAWHGCTTLTPRLQPGRRTLTEKLKSVGYRTAGFWSGPYLHPFFGLGQGFDEYVNCADFGPLSEEWAGQAEAHHQSASDVTNPHLTDSVIRWMRARASQEAGAQDDPFFLFVHMWDVHYDYIPPAPYDTLFGEPYTGAMDGTNRMLRTPRAKLDASDVQHAIALYDGEIAWTDMHVGRILQALEECGWRENTLVILTSDHGDEFWEHGKFGHRKTLFDESVAIPLVIRYPPLRREGIVVEAVASITDIAPTILELTASGDMGPLGGRSLVGLIMGKEPVGPRVALSELTRPKLALEVVSVRSADWMILFDVRSGEPMGAWDLNRDPAEGRDLLALGERVDPDWMRAARAAYARLRDPVRRDAVSNQGDGASAGDGEIPAEVFRTLSDLGYIGNEDED